MTRTRMRIFVAGATGATGQVFVPMATAAGHDLVIHVRPQSKDKTPLGADARARVFDLADAPALKSALAGCDAVLSMIGTMRSRFGAGDTYASSDVATSSELALGARDAGVSRFLLLSSLGAGGLGAYLKAKGESERIVRESGLAWTIFRPSSLVSPHDALGAVSAHGTRSAPPAMGGIVSALGHLPGLSGWALDTKPIPIEVLCRAFLRVLATPADGKIFKGRELWTLGEH